MSRHSANDLVCSQCGSDQVCYDGHKSHFCVECNNSVKVITADEFQMKLWEASYPDADAQAQQMEEDSWYADAPTPYD